MMRSTMLQSRISKTKKRLSEDQWMHPIIIVGLMGILAILTFSLRSTSLTWNFAIIPGEIPVISTPIDDPTYHRFKEIPADVIANETVTIAFTSRAFFFGKLKGFTRDYVDSREKFVVPHDQGTPQTGELLSQIGKWLGNQDGSPHRTICVLIPAGDIPVAILAQVMEHLRQSPFFERVVLAGSLI